MTKLQTINCPLCNLEKSKTILFFGNKLFPLNISICQGCGFVFQNPRFDVKGWDNYYRNDYYNYHRGARSEEQMQESNLEFNVSVNHKRLSDDNRLKGVESMLDIGASQS